MAVHHAEIIKCTDCGSEGFMSVFQLVRHPGKGITTKPTGYKCAQCHLQINLGSLVKELDLKRRKAEMEQIQQEIEAMEA